MQVSRTARAIALGLAWLSAGAIAGRNSAAAEEFHLQVIALNDFHGNLESPGKFRSSADSPLVPVGGADYLAGYVANLKSKNPDNVVVSAGDVTGGGPLISELFHGEDTIEAMNRLGLEINGVGNHEFDKGIKELIRLQKGGCLPARQDTCKGTQTGTPVPFEGAKFEYLAANVFYKSTGKTIFPAYAIKTYHGVRVAFIGVTLKDTPANATVSSVAGLRFGDEADAINGVVRRLRAQGIESFVALIHQGGFQTRGAVDINGCAGDMEGQPIRAIVSRLDDAVDLVVSAHTHIAYVCQLPNVAGRKVPVTQASSYGRVLSDIDMTIDTATRNVTHVSAHNILVDRTNPDIKPDIAIAHIVGRYVALAAPAVDRVIGSVSAEIKKAVNDVGESPMGELAADAQLEATAAPRSGGAVAAFMNDSGVRTGLLFASDTPSLPDGKITFGRLFGAQPFGNILVTMTLTGAQIKDLLEEQFKGCGLDASPGEEASTQNRQLDMSDGFAYSYSQSAPPCSKVDPASIKIRGVTVSPAAKYRVTVNSFLAEGGADFYVLKKGTDRVVGVSDIDATIAYFARHSPVAPTASHRVTILP